MELVTGYGGKAHITPENWADLNRGFSGADSYVMGTGRKFEAELISNNLLKIHDGCGIMQGRQVVIPKGRSDEVAIENGTQGMKRIDLIVERYTKNPDTKIETTETVIIKGTQLPDISFCCLSRHIMNYYFKQSRIKATADHMDKFVIDSSRPVRLTSEIYQKSSGSLCINFYQTLQKFLIISRW